MGYFTPSLVTIFLLGFASGLPLALTGSTLATWLSDTGVDIAAIGLFAAVATPYSLKFIWSPFMDTLRVPFPFARLGRRRGWIMLTQICLVASLTILGSSDPARQISLTVAMAFAVAFFSASQDIVIDAYRVELVDATVQPKAIFMVQLGYRAGMIASSAGGLFMAGRMGWHDTYTIMAALMLVGMITVLLAKEPDGPTVPRRKGMLWYRTFLEPFREFTRHHGWWLILMFVIIYKLADAFIGMMTNPFLRGLGFSKDEIAGILKLYGVIATLLGTFAGSALVMRYGAVKIMFAAGLLHALTNLLYVLQARVGADSQVLILSVSLENLTGGISSAAFVAFLSGLCNRYYTATQYALLSSLAALGRTWLSTPAGYVVKYCGWEQFFLFSALLALPGLGMLYWLQKHYLPNFSRPGH